MKKLKKRTITWKTIRVKAKQINPTPNNYKIQTDIGRQRLNTSLDKYGKAGTVVCNYAAKGDKAGDRYDLIDGNSRWKDEMEINPNNYMEVSVPSRKLTKSEYEEMAAMFDFAVAGEVDVDRIKKEKGTTKDWYETWGVEVPFEILETLGSKAEIKNLQYKGSKERGGKTRIAEVAGPAVTMQVNLFFTVKQEKDFRKWEELFSAKFKTDNTTDTVYKVFKKLSEMKIK